MILIVGRYFEQAAFIAGIQTQVIALCIALPKSGLSRTANVFAFVGLFLDVIGTATGVAHSLVLQHKIKEITTLQSINSRLTKEAVDIGNQSDESQLEEFKQKFDRFARVMNNRYPPRDEILRFGLLALPINTAWVPAFVQDQIGLASSILNLVQAAQPRSGNSGPSGHLAPVATMVFGIVFLGISVLLVAVGLPSLSKEVWIACTVTVVLLTGGMILPGVYYLNVEKMETKLLINSSSRSCEHDRTWERSRAG